MDIFIDLIVKFIFKWVNKVVLGTPMEMWGAQEWALFSVVVFSVFSVVYLLIKNRFYSEKPAYAGKKKK